MAEYGRQQPTMSLFVVDKNNKKHKTLAGAAWPSEFGGFTIKLNPGVVLKWDDEVYFNLNPRMSKAEYRKFMTTGKEAPPAQDQEDLSYLDDFSEATDLEDLQDDDVAGD